MSPPRSYVLALAAVCLSPVAGQAQTSLGVGAGIARPHNADSQLRLTANLRFPVGKRLALEPEAAYWPGRASPRDVTVEFKDVYVGGTAVLRFASARVTAFAGGGGGIHRFDLASQGTRPGFHGVVGTRSLRLPAIRSCTRSRPAASSDRGRRSCSA
jgi:hypothetical protein